MKQALASNGLAEETASRGASPPGPDSRLAKKKLAADAKPIFLNSVPAITIESLKTQKVRSSKMSDGAGGETHAGAEQQSQSAAIVEKLELRHRDVLGVAAGAGSSGPSYRLPGSEYHEE